MMSETRSIIFTRAFVPAELQQAWLQHMRDFDTAHPGCHFEVAVDAPEEPFADVIKKVTITPRLTFAKYFSRTEWRKP